MIEQKLVSIIIPAYNVAPYLQQCLDSVIVQSYINLEIIVVNDGSTDTTAEIIARYEKKDGRIKSIHKQNGGLSSARNAGLAIAKGEFFVIFDSDDIMLPFKIERHVSWFAEHLSYRFVYSDLIHFYNKTTHMYELSIRHLGKDQYESLLVGNCINPNTVCMKREVYEKIGGFDESLRSAEDWDYWLRMVKMGFLIGYQSEKLTLYRMRKDSLSTDLVTMYKTALYVLEKQKKDCLPFYVEVIDRQTALWRKKLKFSYIKNEVKSSLGFKKVYYFFLAHIIKIIYRTIFWYRLKSYKNKIFLKILLQHGK